MSVAVWFDDNFNILIEFYEEAQQPFNRELAEFSAQHLGNVGLANAEQRRRFGLCIGQRAKAIETW